MDVHFLFPIYCLGKNYLCCLNSCRHCISKLKYTVKIEVLHVLGDFKLSPNAAASLGLSDVTNKDLR